MTDRTVKVFMLNGNIHTLNHVDMVVNDKSVLTVSHMKDKATRSTVSFPLTSIEKYDVLEDK